MKKINKRLNFATRLSIFFIVIILFIIAAITIINNIFFERTLNDVQERNINNLIDTVHTVTNTAVTTAIETHLIGIAKTNVKIINSYYNRYLNGEISEEEAKELSRELLLSQKIGQTGYMYVLNIENGPEKLLLEIHPFLEKNLDATESELSVATYNLKNGYMEYDYQPEEDGEIFKKAVGMAYFEPWGWVVATSSYKSEFIDLVNPEIFREELLSIKIGESDYVYILNSKGDVIIHPTLEGQNLYNEKDKKDGKYFIKKIIENKLDDDQVVEYYWEDNDGNIKLKKAEHRYLEEMDWIIVTSYYYDEIFGVLITQRNITIIISLIFMLISVPIILLFGRSISKPFKKITSIVDEISRGKVEIQDVNLHSSKEFSVLSNSIETMINFLKNRNDLMNKVSEGDLTIEVKLASEDDDVGKSLHNMIGSLNRIVQEITNAIGQVSQGADQISDSSQSLSQGSSLQASSLEEISASINEINTQIQSNSEYSIKASEMSEVAKNNADKGRNQMEQLVRAMEEINKSAKDIKNIVKVIDDIAFQTNLLALNADIEAARVGKYGKGFAVVANSVRNLAAKSQKSVQETTGMVEKAIKNIEIGVDYVNVTSQQLDDIVKSSVEVTKISKEVSLSSQEQTRSIEQISTGLNQIEDVVQANSANAEENAASSEELSVQSNKLKELVSFFKTENNQIKGLKLKELT
jgi:methyl-accepting chemotaxis protein